MKQFLIILIMISVFFTCSIYLFYSYGLESATVFAILNIIISPISYYLGRLSCRKLD